MSEPIIRTLVCRVAPFSRNAPSIKGAAVPEPKDAWEQGSDLYLLSADLAPGAEWIGGPYFSSRDADALKEIGVTQVRIYPSFKRTMDALFAEPYEVEL